jgi:hypothetical protein
VEGGADVHDATWNESALYGVRPWIRIRPGSWPWVLPDVK